VRRATLAGLTFLLASGAGAAESGSASTKSLADLSLEDLVNVKVTSVSKREENLNDTAAAICELDLVISVETIEHLRNVSVFSDFLARNEVPRFIVTYPSKKTTHYNKFHFHDLTLGRVEKLFHRYRLERHFNWEHEFDVCFFGP
jgi:hypothetical protein